MVSGLWLVLGVLAAVVLSAVVAGQAGAFKGRMPARLGVLEGKLKSPSQTPNSVSSQADLWPENASTRRALIAPLALVGDGPATMAKLRAIVESIPGAEVLKVEPDYLYATFTSVVFKFVDDLEFWFDPINGVVQVRSASRVGRSDKGVNRARVEALRARLAAD